MEPYSLQFDPEAFGTPQAWSASEAYVTWNRRQVFKYEPGPFPITPAERLADFYIFWIRAVTVLAFRCRGVLHRRRKWNLNGSGSLGCLLEEMQS